ncbi:MAG: hypothetical protein H0W58_11665 [Acidobacteria bacterium]|nr:hypothetical protein [Acidobacteriota bacterium]
MLHRKKKASKLERGHPARTSAKADEMFFARAQMRARMPALQFCVTSVTYFFGQAA